MASFLTTQPSLWKQLLVAGNKTRSRIRSMRIIQHNPVNDLTSLVEDGEAKLRSSLKAGKDTWLANFQQEGSKLGPPNARHWVQTSPKVTEEQFTPKPQPWQHLASSLPSRESLPGSRSWRTVRIGGVALRHKVTSTNCSRKDYPSREITSQLPGDPKHASIFKENSEHVKMKSDCKRNGWI